MQYTYGREGFYSLTHWRWDEIDAISQTTFSNTFSLMKINEFRLGRFSLKFVPKVRINNIPSLVQIMAWRRPGDKPLSEPMMVCLLTHICVTGPQWVNSFPESWWRYRMWTRFDIFLLLVWTSCWTNIRVIGDTNTFIWNVVPWLPCLYL